MPLWLPIRIETVSVALIFGLFALCIVGALVAYCVAPKTDGKKRDRYGFMLKVWSVLGAIALVTFLEMLSFRCWLPKYEDDPELEIVVRQQLTVISRVMGAVMLCFLIVCIVVNFIRLHLARKENTEKQEECRFALKTLWITLAVVAFEYFELLIATWATAPIAVNLVVTGLVVLAFLVDLFVFLASSEKPERRRKSKEVLKVLGILSAIVLISLGLFYIRLLVSMW